MRPARRLLPLLLVVLAALATSAGGSASTPRGWQVTLATEAQGVFPIGWASGRVWFAVEGSQGDFTVYSARVGVRGLSSLVATSEGKNEWLPDSFVLGSSLVNCCVPQLGQSAPGSSTAPLLASGKVGAWALLTGDPEKTTQNTFTPPDQYVSGRWHAATAIAIGGRTIWGIVGKTCPNSGPHQCTTNGGGFSHFALCCTTAGQPSDITPLLTDQLRGTATDPAMGVDARGRLWLAWLDGASSKPGIAFKLVQLDPATLKPLSSKTLDHTLLFDAVGSTSFALVCTESCRLAYQGLFGAFSWDGNRTPTKLWTNDVRRGTGGHLLGAAPRAGGLDVANLANAVANAPDNGQRLTLEHGDAGGRKLHAVGSVGLRPTLADGPTHALSLQGVPATIFTPSGLVALAFYQSDRGSRGRLLTAVLPA